MPTSPESNTSSSLAEPGNNIQDLEEKKKALAPFVERLRAKVDGKKLREQLSVKTIPGTKIIHTRIRLGPEEWTEQNPLKNLALLRNLNDAPANDKGLAQDIRRKQIDIIATPKTDGYDAKVIGGEKLYLMTAEGDRPMRSAQTNNYNDLVADVAGSSNNAPFVLQNASFYNMGMAAPDGGRLPAHQPIGETVVNGEVIGSVPKPADYADVYHKTNLKNSSLETAPLLAEGGEKKFTTRTEDLYKYSSNTGKPGQMGHFGDRNARSMMDFPKNGPKPTVNPYSDKMEKATKRAERYGQPFNKDELKKNIDTASVDRFRSVLATTKSDDPDDRVNGLTMDEAAFVMTAVNKMNITPGHAINLDGGGSSSISVRDGEGRALLNISQNLADISNVRNNPAHEGKPESVFKTLTANKDGRFASTLIEISQEREN
jgi:hypothetical protein